MLNTWQTQALSSRYDFASKVQGDTGMPTCKYERGDYKCEYDSDATTSGGFCILHSPNPEKDEKAFMQALAAHRGEKGDVFVGFVFPASFTFETFKFSGDADFAGAEFSGKADFASAEFSGKADYGGAKFSGKANFWGAKFSGKANFEGAKFTGKANFESAWFGGKANFERAKFTGKANFECAWFGGEANFGSAEFRAEANFESARFSGKTKFTKSKFLRRSRFVSGKEENKIIQIFCSAKPEAAVDFTDVIIEPLDSLIFRDVDLQRCRFQGTDLRKAEITGAKWPRIGSRFGAYDEIAMFQDGETRSWPHIERLYRELKQNCEDRKDYDRASDFHYGEKEMRRKNPDTPWRLKVPLWLYWLVSGYGERSLRPLLWALGLLTISTFCYLWWGLLRLRSTGPVSDPFFHWTNIWEVGLYGLKVMTLLKPSNFEPVGLWGDVINTLQSILGPALIGLFALAIRQRLKR